ncbi:MAG: hypothetical protein ACI8ZB_004584 [Desulforhopalus sp.]|jgi:hypothetical protein
MSFSRLLVKVNQHLFGKKGTGKLDGVRPDDTFIVSYPKSGNTWLRHMLSVLITHDSAIKLEQMDCLVPDLNIVSKNFLDSLPPPRIMKSHTILTSQYKRIIYLVRDPRDVAVSLWHHQRRAFMKSEQELPWDVFWRGFISDGSWRDHVGGWLGARDNHDDFMLIKYEDLKVDTCKILKMIAGHCGLSVSDSDIEKAYLSSSIEKLRAKERAERKKWEESKYSDSNMNFFRRGAIGDGKELFTAEQLVDLEKNCGPLMLKLGYQLNNRE